METIKKTWQNGRLGKAIIIMGTFMAGCFACYVCGVFAPGNKKLVEIPTNTPAPGITFQLNVTVIVPTATPTPEPTATAPPPATLTPTPSPTATPADTPTPTLEPAQRLPAAIRGALVGDDRLVSYRDFDGELVVEFAISDLLTDEWIKDGARRDITKILEAAAEFGPDIGYTGVIINGTFSMLDTFGNSSQDVVVHVYYSRGTVERIDFSNFLADNVYIIADKSKIHPGLSD